MGLWRTITAPVRTTFNALADIPGSPEAVMLGLSRGFNGEASWNPYSEGQGVLDIMGGGNSLSQDPRNRRTGRQIGTAIGSYFTAGLLGGGVAGSAGSGAIWGGAQAAGTGGNVLEGASRGAAIGAGTAALASSYNSSSAPSGGDAALVDGGDYTGFGGSFDGTAGGETAAGGGYFEGSPYDGFGGYEGGVMVTPAELNGFSPAVGGVGADNPSYAAMAQNYFKRMWATPVGRMALMRMGMGVYANQQMRRLNKRLDDTDITKMPGYATGEKSVRRRMAAMGYGNSTNMLKEIQDYGAREYSNYAANERQNYQARTGALMNEMTTLGMLSLGLGF